MKLTICSILLTAGLMMGQTKPAPATPATPATPAAPAKAATKAASKKSTTVVVHLNTSSSAELQAVKGIGAATAAKIIAGRPWAKIDDLVTKKAMNKAQFAGIKGQLQL